LAKGSAAVATPSVRRKRRAWRNAEQAKISNGIWVRQIRTRVEAFAATAGL
jgi:hypothetical protein